MMKPCILNTIAYQDNKILNVCFSPDKSKYSLCSVGRDHNVYLAKIESDGSIVNESLKVFHGHKHWIRGSAFSSNGSLLSTSSYDKTIRIWNLNGEDEDCIVLEGHNENSRDTRFFRNDLMKVISCGESNVKSWDIVKQKEIVSINELSRGERIWTIDIHRDDQTVICGDSSFNIRICDLRSGKCVKKMKNCGDTSDTSESIVLVVYSIQFHPNFQTFTTGCADQFIRTFDFRTYQQLEFFENNDNNQSVLSVSHHPSGKYLVSGFSGGDVKIYDLSKKTAIHKFELGSSCVWGVDFSSDGKRFASGNIAGNLCFWSFPQGEYLCRGEKDSDEDERIDYLLGKYLVVDDEVGERRNDNLMIRIGGFLNLYSFKIFLLT